MALVPVVLGAVILVPRWLPRGSPAEQPPPPAEAGEIGRTPKVFGPSWAELDDPVDDGWETEVFSSRAQTQLKLLGKMLLHREEITEAALSGLVASDFVCSSLIPQDRTRVFGDSGFTVERGASGPAEPPVAHHGASGLATALQRLAGGFEAGPELRFYFKLFRVSPADGGASTRQYFSLSGRNRGVQLEQNSVWTVDWDTRSTNEPPKLKAIRVSDFEQVARAGEGGGLFMDCARSVLEGNASYRNQLLLGYNYWLERIQDTRYFTLLGAPGVAVGDVNGDGLDDLYVTQEGGLPNLLYVQKPDGTAEDRSEFSQADWLESSRGVLLVDLDNDGDQDLAVTTLGNLILAANDGEGRFDIRAVLPTADDTFSLCAADYDGDADLDLYVCAYNRNDLTDSAGVLSDGGTGNEFVFHDANNGAPNTLFRNDTGPASNWSFQDVTAAVGLDVNNRRFTFAAIWEDYDNDGDQDLYVANDYGRNNLYRNDGGRFLDVAGEAQAEDSASGMGIISADVDHDGWMDFHVSNMFSAAGGRVTYQDTFKAGSPGEVRERIQRFARGNTLLQNEGDGTFSDSSEEAGINMGRWAWGAGFVDVNNDGWEDILVANGYLTTEDTGDL